MKRTEESSLQRMAKKMRARLAPKKGAKTVVDRFTVKKTPYNASSRDAVLAAKLPKMRVKK